MFAVEHPEVMRLLLAASGAVGLDLQDRVRCLGRFSLPSAPLATVVLSLTIGIRRCASDVARGGLPLARIGKAAANDRAACGGKEV